MMLQITYQETREQWLERMANRLVSQFMPGPMPAYKVTCSWPSEGGLKLLGKGRVRGECWNPVNCKDGITHQIFIHPELDTAEQVLPVLLHELTHAYVGLDQGHRWKFAKHQRKIGFVKPWTDSIIGDALRATLNFMSSTDMKYPHAGVSEIREPRHKKQGTRMVKLLCPDCEYNVRTTRKWIDVGLPTCPCGTGMIEADITISDEEDD